MLEASPQPLPSTNTATTATTIITTKLGISSLKPFRHPPSHSSRLRQRSRGKMLRSVARTRGNSLAFANSVSKSNAGCDWQALCPQRSARSAPPRSNLISSSVYSTVLYLYCTVRAYAQAQPFQPRSLESDIKSLKSTAIPDSRTKRKKTKKRKNLN